MYKRQEEEEEDHCSIRRRIENGGRALRNPAVQTMHGNRQVILKRVAYILGVTIYLIMVYIKTVGISPREHTI